MGKRRTDAAAIEIDHAALLATRKNDAPAKEIAPLMLDQSGAQQELKGEPEIGQMLAQRAASSMLLAQA